MPSYLSINEFPGDGSTVQYNFSFAGGYIDKSHVKATVYDAAGVSTPITITAPMWVGPNTLNLGVAAPIGGYTKIYRDTPRNEPLVDFADQARMREANLDLLARQTIFVAAEAFDAGSYAAVNDLLSNAAASAAAAEDSYNNTVAAGNAATAAALAQASAAAASAAAAATSASEAATFDPDLYQLKAYGAGTVADAIAARLPLAGGTMTGDLGVVSMNGGQLAGLRNKLINGNFAVNQLELSGTVTLAAGAYGHDCWKAGASGCIYTFTKTGGVTTITITTGSLINVIDGINLVTRNHTLSWTGTAQGKVGAGSFAASGITVAVTGGTNLNVEFGTGTLSLVQFEPGAIATPFEHRLDSFEEQLCFRYFEIGYAANLGTCSSGNGFGVPISFKARKRAVPTMSYVSGSLNSNIPYTTPNWNSISKDSAVFYVATSTTGSGYVSLGYQASARL